MTFLLDHWEVVGAIILFAVSEIVGLNPKWKTNTVIQIVLAILGRVFKRPA